MYYFIQRACVLTTPSYYCSVLQTSFCSILMGLRTVCVDWLNNEEPKDDPAMRGEKDPKTGYRVELPRRNVGVSSTQVSWYCIATISTWLAY